MDKKKQASKGSKPIKKAFKYTFWTIFTIVFIATTIFTANLIIQNIFGSTSEVIITDAIYTCENKNTENEKLAYVYLRGFGDHNPGSVYFITDSTPNSPLLDFDYDESLSLEQINSQFVTEFNSFTTTNELNKIIIFAHSAGGVIASSTITNLAETFPEQIEIHTLASPLNGYDAPKSLFEGYTGVYNNLAVGIDSYDPEPKNINVYHHKTVTDEILVSICGRFHQFCDALDAQNNNVPGSEEFYYPNEDHNSIVHTVGLKVIACNQ